MTQQRYVKTLYGFTVMHLAMKVQALQQYLKDKDNGVIEILPLYFDLRENNWHRQVKVRSVNRPDELKLNMEYIEREVNARRDIWGKGWQP